MKQFLLPLMLLTGVVTQGQAQDCCQGFEANFTFVHANNPLGVVFTNASAGEWNAVGWNFGDGTTANEANPDHLYAEPGVYQVCVVIENNQDCRSEFCMDVAVGTEEPLCEGFRADFNAEVGLENLGAHFFNTSPMDSQFRLWTFGDGQSFEGSNPVHHYENPGVYQACLVIEMGDCRSEYCREICVVDPNPCEEFGVSFTSVLSQVSPMQINFNGQFHGGVDFIVWHFGDDQSSNAEHPEHVYAEPGTYEVCLVGENNEGCRSEYCVSITVGQELNPCQGFEAGFSSVADDAPNAVNFSSNSTGEWNFMVWNFGDGTTGSGLNPSHSYAESGNYEVCIVIENNQDCRSEFCHHVAVGQEINPCADFIADFTVAHEPGSLAASFTNTSGVESPFHVWHFGDGSSSQDYNVNHTYAEPGTYQTCLILEEGECRSEYCQSFTVGAQEAPCAGFEASFTYIVDLVEGGVQFENLSVGDITSYQWFFGDDTQSDDATPNHEFSTTGLHHVCLVVENAQGCVAEYCANVHVPVYYFYMTQPTGIAPVEASSPTLQVFPNPCTDILRLGTTTPSRVDIVDMQGRVVATVNQYTTGTIAMTHLTSGLYLVRATAADGQTQTARVLKL
jgi:PKD repeat protein